MSRPQNCHQYELENSRLSRGNIRPFQRNIFPYKKPGNQPLYINTQSKKHNRAILNRKPTISEDGCNCREKTRCPLKNKSLTTSIIYEANVISDSENREKKYIGLTEGTFKKRFYGHQLSFKDRKYLKSSKHSKHIWKFKDQGRNYRISWKIKNKATPYINGTKRCDLCLSEKLCILKADKAGLLNKRSELNPKCRHENKFYTKNCKGRVT